MNNVFTDISINLIVRIYGVITASGCWMMVLIVVGFDRRPYWTCGTVGTRDGQATPEVYRLTSTRRKDDAGLVGRGDGWCGRLFTDDVGEEERRRNAL